MKFSTTLSAFVLVLPLIAAASPANNNKGANANKKGAAAKATVAASSTSAAAAASTSVAATGIKQDAGKAEKDAQTSTTLDPSQIMPGLAQDGQAVQEAGQVPSLTSTNNFINFCLTRPDLPLMNGQQVLAGACNPTPMGVILAKDKMPSVKFTNPVNNQVLPANVPFTINLAVKNLISGNFVNPQTNYLAAPAHTDPKTGILIGHNHVAVEKINSISDTTVTDPTKFAFFKGMNVAAVNGILSADVTAGLPAGVYRVCSMTAAANHQPALAVVAQHGVFDDCAFFTVSATAKGAQKNPPASSSAAAPAATTAAAAAAGGNAKGGNAAAAKGGNTAAKKGGNNAAKKGGKKAKKAKGRGRKHRSHWSREE